MKSFEEIYKEIKNDELIIQTEKKTLKERKKYNIVTILLCFIIESTFGVIWIKGMGIYGLVFPLFLCMLIIYGRNIEKDNALNKKRKKYNSVFKEYIIKKIINNFFDNANYIYDKGISKEIYDEAGYKGSKYARIFF